MTGNRSHHDLARGRSHRRREVFGADHASHISGPVRCDLHGHAFGPCRQRPTRVSWTEISYGISDWPLLGLLTEMLAPAGGLLTVWVAFRIASRPVPGVGSRYGDAQRAQASQTRSSRGQRADVRLAAPLSPWGCFLDARFARHMKDGSCRARSHIHEGSCRSWRFPVIHHLSQKAPVRACTTHQPPGP